MKNFVRLLHPVMKKYSNGFFDLSVGSIESKYDYEDGYDFNRKFDKVLKKLVDKHIIPFLFTLGRSVVLKAKQKH